MMNEEKSIFSSRDLRLNLDTVLRIYCSTDLLFNGHIFQRAYMFNRHTAQQTYMFNSHTVQRIY